MNKLFTLIALFLVIGCKPKQIILVQPSRRPAFEKQVPDQSNYNLVESFFNEWSKVSIPIGKLEFEQIDTIEKNCYKIYESLISDTSVLNTNLNSLKVKFILIPNSIFFGYTTNYRKEFEMLLCEDIQSKKILNFRPRISLKNKAILYYTKEYQDTLPKFAEKYGVGGFLEIKCYLRSNFPKYLETSPFITNIINIRNTNKYIISYYYRNGSYESLLEKIGDKWIKIEDLTHWEVD